MTFSTDVGLQGQDPVTVAIRLRRDYRHVEWERCDSRTSTQDRSPIKPLRKEHEPDVCVIEGQNAPDPKKD